MKGRVAAQIADQAHCHGFHPRPVDWGAGSLLGNAESRRTEFRTAAAYISGQGAAHGPLRAMPTIMITGQKGILSPQAGPLPGVRHRLDHGAAD